MGRSPCLFQDLEPEAKKLSHHWRSNGLAFTGQDCNVKIGRAMVREYFLSVPEFLTIGKSSGTLKSCSVKAGGGQRKR